MNDILRKGRPLQLDGLASTPVKVTVGFKCDGQAKIQLAREAHQAEMTLSEYVEYLLSLRHQTPQATTPVADQAPQLRDQLHRLRQQLAVYEDDKQLQHLFATHQGQTVSWPEATGQTGSLVISHVSDVFKLIVHSFASTL